MPGTPATSINTPHWKNAKLRNVAEAANGHRATNYLMLQTTVQGKCCQVDEVTLIRGNKKTNLVLSAAGESNSASTQESSFGPKKNVACHLCSLYCGKQSCIDLAQALGENALVNLTQDLWHQGLF